MSAFAIAKVRRAFVEVEMPTDLERPIESRNVQSSESINIGIDSLPAHRNDGPEADIATKNLARRNPQKRRHC
jgi:hypothetical protein